MALGNGRFEFNQSYKSVFQLNKIQSIIANHMKNL